MIQRRVTKYYVAFLLHLDKRNSSRAVEERLWCCVFVFEFIVPETFSVILAAASLLNFNELAFILFWARL